MNIRNLLYQKIKTRRHFSSNTCQIGAREAEVEEPVLAARSVLFEFEVNEVAEPKALLARNLQKLVLRYGSSILASKAIGASEAFVRQNARS